MTKQSQLLAIEKGVNTAAQRTLTDAYHAIQRAPGFAGLIRSYTPKDDEGETLPGESTKVQQTVSDLLERLRNPLARLLDVAFEKDSTNRVAAADIVVDGQVIITGAPVTYMLWLEKRLVDLGTFVDKWPVLDPADDWKWDDDNSVFEAAPVETLRSTKIPEPLVLYPATDKHPAQVQVHNKDVTVGKWTTTKLSGAVPLSYKQATQQRIEKLLLAVRQAREEANAIDVVQVPKVGASILEYVFPA